MVLWRLSSPTSPCYFRHSALPHVCRSLSSASIVTFVLTVNDGEPYEEAKGMEMWRVGRGWSSRREEWDTPLVKTPQNAAYY